MTLEKIPFTRNIETYWTNQFERQGGNISMIYFWNTSQIWKILASNKSGNKQKEIYSYQHQI